MRPILSQILLAVAVTVLAAAECQTDELPLSPSLPPPPFFPPPPSGDPPISVVGRSFDVVSINDAALPTDMERFTFRPPCTADTVERSELRFLGGGVLEVWMWLDPSDVSVSRRTLSYTQDGAKLTFNMAFRSARLSGDTLTMESDVPLTCLPHRWFLVARPD